MVSQLHNYSCHALYNEIRQDYEVNCELNEVNFFVNWNVCKGLWGDHVMQRIHLIHPSNKLNVAQ